MLNKEELKRAFNKNTSRRINYSIIDISITSRAAENIQPRLLRGLQFVPLHPSKIEYDTEKLWKLWSMRNYEQKLKTTRRSKLDSAFNRKLNLGEVDSAEDLEVSTRIYTDLYEALRNIPKDSFIYVGIYTESTLVEAFDRPTSKFLQTGGFLGTVLLRIE